MCLLYHFAVNSQGREDRSPLFLGQPADSFRQGRRVRMQPKMHLGRCAPLISRKIWGMFWSLSAH